MWEFWDIVISVFIEVGELSKVFEVFGEMVEVVEKKIKGEVLFVIYRMCGVFVIVFVWVGEFDFVLEWFNSL